MTVNSRRIRAKAPFVALIARTPFVALIARTSFVALIATMLFAAWMTSMAPAFAGRSGSPRRPAARSAAGSRRQYSSRNDRPRSVPNPDGSLRSASALENGISQPRVPANNPNSGFAGRTATQQNAQNEGNKTVAAYRDWSNSGPANGANAGPAAVPKNSTQIQNNPYWQRYAGWGQSGIGKSPLPGTVSGQPLSGRQGAGAFGAVSGSSITSTSSLTTPGNLWQFPTAGGGPPSSSTPIVVGSPGSNTSGVTFQQALSNARQTVQNALDADADVSEMTSMLLQMLLTIAGRTL
jgi:hypothetical protein